VSRGEFRVEGGFRVRGNSVSRGEFRVEGGIPCRGVNSVMRGEFRVKGGIVDTQLYIVYKIFFNCFYYKYRCFFVFSKML
jgi:hypothetical protein